MYAFGCWDFEENGAPMMVNRLSGERIIRRGPLTKGVAPDDGPWFRFDYVHSELRYPLAIKWALEQREIVVDHNLSARLWRETTHAPGSHPSYGAFVRVDDCIIDAILCYPEVARRIRSQDTGGIIRRIGGWTSEGWNETLCLADLLHSHGDPAIQQSFDRPDWPRKQSPIALRPLDAQPRSDWKYMELPRDCSWRGVDLFPNREDYYSKAEHEYRSALSLKPIEFDRISVGGLVPQIRAGDDEAIVFPINHHQLSRHGSKPYRIMFLLRDTRAGSMIFIKQGPLLGPSRLHARHPWFIQFDRAPYMIPDVWEERDVYNQSDYRETPLVFIDNVEDYASLAKSNAMTFCAWSAYGQAFWTRFLIEACFSWRGTEQGQLWPPDRDSPGPPYGRPKDMCFKLGWRGGMISPEEHYRVATLLDDLGEAELALEDHRKTLKYHF